MSDVGCRKFGSRKLEVGGLEDRRPETEDQWSVAVDCGRWSVDCGIWTVDYRLSTMVC
ncbi:hypothetical protein [Algoriphagus vanfongensis]|uniref:hypothetical protein n=1 Tax=Algoriphagus vanfongensis TaxID=426371 RepID=UPI001470BCEE|nr:hypothetical protein [Algoriphagus vanfongensis]